MVMKIRGSDESFRRRMWKRIETDKNFMKDMPREQKKKIYLDLMELQHQCELQCLKFDSWESGREELKICLLSEQTKVGDLLYMKYKVQQPIFELGIADDNLQEDQDVKDLRQKYDEEMLKAKTEHEK